MGPAIIVFPDCFTALGGNQYVNSSAIGNYADYLTREIVPFVDREFRTLASRVRTARRSSSSFARILSSESAWSSSLPPPGRRCGRSSLPLRRPPQVTQSPEKA